MIWKLKKYMKIKRYKQAILYIVSEMINVYNSCDNWHVKQMIENLIAIVQNFWYAPRSSYVPDYFFCFDEILYVRLLATLVLTFGSYNPGRKFPHK